MNDWLVILAAIIFFVFIFVKSSSGYRAGYIIFILWYYYILKEPDNHDKIHNFIGSHGFLNIAYKALCILLIGCCVIGVLQSFVRIFSGNKLKSENADKQKEPSEKKSPSSEKQQTEGGLEREPEKKRLSQNKAYFEKPPADISEPEKQEENSGDYLMDRVYLFNQRRSFWDGKAEENIEKKIYQELKLFIDDAYNIIPHVAFREIFRWGDWWNDRKLTDRVTKMHFDFGIYNKELQPILFIEIQGKEHKENPKVIERDKFKAAVMEHCGMKLITIDCSGPMTDQEIREKVVACIKKEVPDRQAYAVYCPNCTSHGKNNLMRITLNKSKNEYFYGCSTFKRGKSDNCPGVSIGDVPPLYYGIPTVKGNG